MAGTGEDQEDLKRKLLRRVAFAGVAAVVLLGGLALFEDYLKSGPADAPAPTTAAPADRPAEAPGSEEKGPEANTPGPEAAQAEDKDANKVADKEEAPQAEPERTTTPLAPAPDPEPRPASRVVIKAGPPAPVAAVKKAAPGPAAAASSPQPDAAIDNPARGYRLQLGVFTSAGNADELHAKLEQAGIPSYIESRVHVGPFKTQQEADAARRKLKELGLGPGLLIPPQKR
ncbi:MAG: SPOR domain-containing protein [Rhodocyclaceae bacterium]